MPASAPPLPHSLSILRKSGSSGSSSFFNPKMVEFDTVTVNYHKVILGDNPAVSAGAPITIHWKSHHREQLSIDVFEEKDPNSCRIRQSNKSWGGYSSEGKKVRKDLRIEVQDRAVLLLKNGYSLEEIGRSTAKTQEIQKERLKSASANAKWDGWNAALESSGKAFKKMIRRGSLGGATPKHVPTNPAA
ncbi:hypothetical protein IV203_025454 [Nitzschia inconspicua]|uniref:Uncharacterized protein n=1 Tax=Nitzschia inconspicua TaxID=303405 RepID=A0A9K3PAG1_9STRA|nr:hypothetical protein IV203_028236 [Nitzschia inconspicua]KAG7362570.1 hypothetical protein IV203_025454 [Nitzschia inconspicua]